MTVATATCRKNAGLVVIIIYILESQDNQVSTGVDLIGFLLRARSVYDYHLLLKL